MKSFNKYFYFVLFALLFAWTPHPSFALEQILNGSFDSNENNWSKGTPDQTSNTMDDLARLNGDGDEATGQACFQARYDQGPAGSNNIYYYSDGYLYQTFPSSAIASDSNAEISFSYKEDADNDGTWVYNFESSILRDDDPTVSIKSIIKRQETDYALLNTTWTQTSTVSTLLPAGYQFRIYFYWLYGCQKNNTVEGRVDQISCNISPSGLVASETTSGNCDLDWHDSTGSPGLAVATDCYRVYRKTSLSDPWEQIGSSGSSDFTDTSVPTADVVYYAVSDVDTDGTESPLSPYATFRTAKLEITKVEASPTEVTIGQSGIPIKVYISNTGYSPMSVDEVDLYFSDPAIGLYTVTPTSSLPVTVGSGSSTIVEFSIDVLDGSNPDTDIIDAIATGTNLQTGVTLTDTEADDNHSWLIRAPANLVVQTITVPSTVYRDQKDVPVSIEVLNDGDKNAAAYWETSNLLFSSGSYSNIRVVDSMPVTVYSGLTKTVDYLVDIDVDCATGPCTVDAEISFRDVNLLISSTNYDGAAVPGEWNVVAGVIVTYKGPPRYPSYTIQADSFNQGTDIVYASAANLIPLYEYRMRWYDPSSTQVRVTDPPLTTDTNGVINDEFQLSATSTLGIWTIDVTGVNTTTPLAQTTFEVVEPATISVELAIPDYVTLDQDFVATMTVTNSGGAIVSDATPGSIVKLAGNIGDATLLSGPTPATSNIDGMSQQEFTFSYNANTVGSFTIEANATGYDDNDSTFLTAATDTSNMCIIQTKPVLTVNSVTESYTNVYRNQTGLTVQMEIENAGEASVYVDAASLSFDVGSYSQSIASPSTMPFLLKGNTTTTFEFTVNVRSSSNTGTDTIYGSFSAYEANDPDSTFAISGGTTGSWDILAASGKCSANSNFVPEQYKYRESMTVFIRFSNLQANRSHMFQIFDVESGGTSVQESGSIESNGSGVCDYQYNIPAAPTIGKWRVEIWTAQTNSGNPQDLQGVQYFDVVNAGNLVTSLNISPNSVELGEEVTVTMSVSNTVANSSTIYPATPSTPLTTAASTGGISLISGPSPASATLSYGSPATFTWTYDTTAHTGVGSLTLTAYATGIDSVTTNAETVESVTSNTALSNRLLILSRDLELASASLILGEVVCGQTVTVYPNLNNTGNTALESVNWQKAIPTHNGDNIPYAYFSFSPESGFSVATFTNQLSSFTLTMPYNQPPGTYIATMSVYDDLNLNEARDLGEPYDEFGVEVTASESKVVVASDKILDLGGWPNDVWVATTTFQAFNGGNLELDNLQFTQLTATFTDSQIFITPMTYGSLATDSILTASVTAYIGAAEAHSTYIATWSIFDATDSYASDTFQVTVSVGTKDFSFTPDPFHIGNGTPTYTIYNQNFTIDNTGTLAITNLEVTPQPLSDGTNTITEDNIFFEIPEQIASGNSKTATVTVYIPGGTAVGDFEGWQLFFDDQDNDGVNSGEANEVEKSLLLQLHVNEFPSLQVIPSTVDLGGIAPGEPPKSVGFLCKNSGNTTLASMTWEKTDLLYDTFSIPQGDYDFTPAPLFSAPPGDIFTATITMAVDITQDAGNYSGSFGWLYDDQLLDGRDANDPNDYFKITCQVGSKEIDITTAGPLTSTGVPNSVSSEQTYTIKNTGTLILTKPKAKITSALVDGAESVPAANAVFNPEVFAYINPGQSKSGTWAMDVPAGQAIGTYTGTLKVWDDTDGDGVPDTTEASDTVSVELRVSGKRVLTASPNPLDLFFVPAGQSSTDEFMVTNTGNIDITGPSDLVQVRKVPLEPTFSGPDPISTSNITFNPALTLSNNLPAGDHLIATVTVDVPLGQTSGAYEGYQRIYVDYNPQNDSFDTGEEYVDMLLQLTVGEKQVSVTSPVDCGSGDTGTTVSKSFTVSNLTSIALSKLKWSLTDLATDTYTIPSSNISFSYPGPFSISSNGSRDVTVYVDIPNSQPAGVYTAQQTVFEDEDGDGSVNSLEASATFDLYVTVNETPGLDILTNSIDLGTVNAGETSSEFTLTYQNNGNVPLTNLDWVTRSLSGAGTIDASLINIVATAPVGTLNPGQTAIATLTLGPIPSDQAAGVYSELQTLRDTSYPATASDSFNLIVTINSDSGLDLAAGTLYQEIATDTFDNTTDEPLVLSSWVAPGTGSAKLSFVEALPDGSIATTRSLTIDSSGNLTTAGAITDSGIAGRATSEYNGSDPSIVNLIWYRVYFKFDYHFDSGTASNTFVVMENANSGATPQDVWFDGVQLEKANFSNQTGPAPYNPKLKIISPTRSTDVQGGRKYYEW